MVENLYGFLCIIFSPKTLQSVIYPSVIFKPPHIVIRSVNCRRSLVLIYDFIYALPRHIGIVTSPSGAAIADMLRILQRRFDGLHIQLYPVRVQGEEAAVEIARGLRHFSEAQSVEVVIVGRGGGSLEDLWAFNEETVARAIAASEVPVISAVGHETDFTIADFVADLRAPTPSAAAELVVRQKAEFLESVRALQSRLAQALRYKLATSGRQLVESSLDRATASVRHQLSQLSQRLDEQSFHLQDQLRRGLRSRERRFRTTIESLARLDLRVKLAQSRSRWDGYSHRLPAARCDAELRLETAREIGLR